eukprot:s1398_g4.t1
MLATLAILQYVFMPCFELALAAAAFSFARAAGCWPFALSAAYYEQLSCALELTVDKTSDKELERWLAEPVRSVILPPSAFLLNRSGYPVLPKKAKALLEKLFRHQVQVIICEPATSAGEHEGLLPRQSYVAQLFQALPPLSQADRFAYTHKDTLQAPLQPLADNLESETYELFETDPVKYARYQEAAFIFFTERKEQGRPLPFCAMVLGAGRGPLVEATLKAAERAEVQIELYAVEKNPNAVHALRHRKRRDGWTSVQFNQAWVPWVRCDLDCATAQYWTEGSAEFVDVGRRSAMARVSCALRAFEVAPSALQSCRPHDVASEFMSRLDPSLAGAGCNIEVYRLQKLREEDQLYEGDELLCRFPTWHFDFTSLEELFQEVEAGHGHVDTLRNYLFERDQQLAAEKRKHKKLRGDLLAIREQTEHLQQLVLDDAAGLDRLSSASNSYRGALPLNSPGPGHLGSQGAHRPIGGPRSEPRWEEANLAINAGTKSVRVLPPAPPEVVPGDMRSWTAPKKADVIISELLGSFGDNELSPECLDGAQRFLADDGVCIPTSYTAALTPVSAPLLWANARQGAAGGGVADLETAYVVHMQHAFYPCSAIKDCFEFHHPKSDGSSNDRSADLDFEIEVDSLVHGFAGYFDCVLYGSERISIHPETFSVGMFSWFPMFFPLRHPQYLPKGSIIRHVCFHFKTVPRLIFAALRATGGAGMMLTRFGTSGHCQSLLQRKCRILVGDLGPLASSEALRRDFCPCEHSERQGAEVLT